MTKAQAQAIVRRYNKDNSYKPARLYSGYSGRGMNGLKTYGAVVPYLPKTTKFRKDNLGLDYILY